MNTEYRVTYLYADKDGKNAHNDVCVDAADKSDAMTQVRQQLEKQGIEPLYLTAEPVTCPECGGYLRSQCTHIKGKGVEVFTVCTGDGSARGGCGWGITNEDEDSHS